MQRTPGDSSCLRCWAALVQLIRVWQTLIESGELQEAAITNWALPPRDQQVSMELAGHGEGLLSWRRLVAECEPQQQAGRETSLLLEVLAQTFTRDARSSLDEFKVKIRMYERACGATFSDRVKIAIEDEHFRRHLFMHVARLVTYSSVLEEIRSVVMARGTLTGPVEMSLALLQTLRPLYQCYQQRPAASSQGPSANTDDDDERRDGESGPAIQSGRSHDSGRTVLYPDLCVLTNDEHWTVTPETHKYAAAAGSICFVTTENGEQHDICNLIIVSCVQRSLCLDRRFQQHTS